MKPTLIKETETLRTWSERAYERNCKPLDFNGYKPLIKQLPEPIGGWICEGPHPHGMIVFGWGLTPGDAYESWTHNEVPF